jgi:hypothetical protein
MSTDWENEFKQLNESRASREDAETRRRQEIERKEAENRIVAELHLCHVIWPAFKSVGEAAKKQGYNVALQPSALPAGEEHVALKEATLVIRAPDSGRDMSIRIAYVSERNFQLVSQVRSTPLPNQTITLAQLTIAYLNQLIGDLIRTAFK